MDSCFLTALLSYILDSIEILFHVDNECYLSDVPPRTLYAALAVVAVAVCDCDCFPSKLFFPIVPPRNQ